MDAPDFYIPIEKDIAQFSHHLRTHQRTIFSARFGDGKSFFLNRFEKDDSVAREYKFIKLYPINYQVVGNEDIFSLLKYDILLQLLVEDMVSEASIGDSLFGLEDAERFLSALLDAFSEVDPSPKAKLPASALKVLSSIAGFTSKWTIGKGGRRAARKLVKRIELSNSLYCEDAATKLIRGSLREWKGKTGKKVALVVEDLDRLDPAHLFRLLNVFSAHMDNIYKHGDSPEESLVGSRFGFDNVVFVLEYENLKSLFGHFYGNTASFTGYINKFIPQGYFEYSLRKSANSYFYGAIEHITGMEQHHISALLNSKINDMSIRDMYYAVKDVDLQVAFDNEKDINARFLYMLVILRRVGMGDLAIVKECENLYKNDPIPFIRYIIDFTLLDGFSDKEGVLKVSDTSMYEISGRHVDGFPTLNRVLSAPTSMKLFSVRTFISRLLGFVLV